jgi:hypothetical protein
VRLFRRSTVDQHQAAFAPEGIVVLGMHRSGTSSIVNLLSHLGFKGPMDPMKPKPDNPEGFGESLGITRLDDLLLYRLGGAWQCPPLSASLEFDDPDWIERGRAAFTTAFGSRNEAHGWVLKDPRISLLLPFWRRVLGPRPLRILCVFRPPEQVVASLASDRRGSSQMTNEALAIANWERYNRAMLEHLEPDDIILFADFDRLLHDEDYRGTFAPALSRFLSPVSPVTASRAAEALEERISWGKTTSRQVPGPLSPERAALRAALEETRLHLDTPPSSLALEDPDTEALLIEHRRCEDPKTCHHVWG